MQWTLKKYTVLKSIKAIYHMHFDQPTLWGYYMWPIILLFATYVFLGRYNDFVLVCTVSLFIDMIDLFCDRNTSHVSHILHVA